MHGWTLRKRIFAAVLAAVIVFSALSTGISAVSLKNQKYYLALGDSITTGYIPGGEHLENTSFAALLSRQNGYIPVNKAVDGFTSADILSLIETGALDAEIEKAELITITCGGNDLLAFLGDSFTITLHEAWQGTAEGLNRIISLLGMDNHIPMITVPDNSRQYESSSGNKMTIGFMYVLFSSFIDGIDDSLAWVNREKKNAPAWKQLLLRTYEDIAGSALHKAESMLTDLTESEKFQMALRAYTDHLNEMIEYIRDRNAHAQIVVLNQYNPYQWFDTPATSILRDFFDKGIRQLNAVIIQNAKSGRYRTADVYTVFAGSENCLSHAAAEPLELDVHPNAEGHARIAECLQEVLDWQWQKNRTKQNTEQTICHAAVCCTRND